MYSEATTVFKFYIIQGASQTLLKRFLRIWGLVTDLGGYNAHHACTVVDCGLLYLLNSCVYNTFCDKCPVFGYYSTVSAPARSNW